MQGGHRGKSIVTIPLFLHRQTRFKIIIRTNIDNIFDEKNNELRTKALAIGVAGSSNRIYEGIFVKEDSEHRAKARFASVRAVSSHRT